ncbi:hydroxymethylglutaryl-CoA lyase [Mycobacterium vicinigordonae]|uniref:Hydroxymethylglutaryl-CoA lyase n=1 Tax=Mycobacterium vicinigordonae TaxID=1719132 RepID=A0A7D6DZ74_9MYCO|nr:hydroxymethylglutaryl-CoA lyase [Mycobacterium vicinigordonae]QLL06161.1 hydroxymethylglutaryl-CoA lyase [Mycobacterium vicinigordonae]
MGDKPEIDIREVGLRDGLQLESAIPLRDKVALLEALAATGVGRIEATSFVSPKAVPALADAAELAAELQHWPEIEFTALVAGSGGARRALAAGMHRLEYVISVTDGHSLANVGRRTEESVALISDIATMCRSEGGVLEVILATAWDCPFEGRTESHRVLDVATRAAAAGATRLCLADTIGTASPGRVVDLVTAVRNVVAGLDIGVHLHNTRGAGLACAWAAWQAGVRSFDASFGGLGGCPFAPGASGNIATEELTYMFEESGIATGISLGALLDAVDLLSQLLGKTLPSNLFRAYQSNSVQRCSNSGTVRSRSRGFPSA